MASFVSVFLLISPALSAQLPNILFILIDDLGWNDISFHNGSDFSTPNIDSMAHQSLILNQYYIQHICSPTRSAFLSGLYPIHTGLQHGVIRPTSPYGVPLNLALLPEDLKRAGYETHAIGKWHCGFFTEDYVPTSRGFDTYFGYYLGAEDYYYHNRSYNGDDGFDLRNDTNAIKKNGKYSTYLFANETLRILKDYHNSKQEHPFFIYLPFQAIHGPLEAPQNVINSFSNISNTDRRKTAAMMRVLDDSLGVIFDTLQNDYLQIWDNLLLIWSTDNGGPVQEQHNNWPLRGSKGTLWEGGVRADGFIGGGYLNSNRNGKVCDELMHITDWYPTLTAFAGIEPTNKSILDGYNMQNVIQNGAKSERTEILHNIDPISCNTTKFEVCGAIHMNMNNSRFKLVIGNEVTGSHSEWERLNDTDTDNTYPTVKCNGKQPKINKTADCPYNGQACLFKLDGDPCEYRDVKNEYKNEYNILWDRLLYYNTTMRVPMNELYPPDPDGANPKKFNDFWSPWRNATKQNKIEL